MLHLMGKQAYKIDLLKNWRIYDVYHVSLLEQVTIKKRRMETAIELYKGDSKEYEIEVCRDSAVYARELEGYLPDLYSLISWKG